MKKIISTILILIGIIFLSIPYLNNLIIKRNLKAKQNIVEGVTVNEIEENNNRKAEYDYSNIKDVEISNTISGITKFDSKNIIGQIIISDLDINLPILKGTTNANLLVGATTMIEDQEMGKKNYPLAGHYMKDKSLLFGGLMDIEKDTIVKITDKKMVYEYRIYDTLIVPDIALHMLDHDRAKERGKPIISLMTCYYTSKNGKRFFALGELIDEYPYEGEQLNIDNKKQSR